MEGWVEEEGLYLIVGGQKAPYTCHQITGLPNQMVECMHSCSCFFHTSTTLEMTLWREGAEESHFARGAESSGN